MGLPAILKNFLNSEKAVASAVPLIIATVFVFTGKITYQQWMNFAETLTAIYVGGKALHGAAAAVGTSKERVTALEARLDANDNAANAALEEKEDAK